MNTIMYYFYTIKFWLQDLIFGEEEVKETQDDEYVGGACYRDPLTGKKECE